MDQAQKPDQNEVIERITGMVHETNDVGEEAIRTVVEGLVKNAEGRTFVDCNTEERAAFVQSVVDQTGGLRSVNNFGLVLLNSAQKEVQCLARLATDDSVIQDVLTNYTFFKRHFSNMLGQFEGAAFSVDKARFCIQMVINARISGVDPEWPQSDKLEFYHPRRVFVCYSQLRSYFEGVALLFHGMPNDYITQMLLISSRAVAAVIQEKQAKGQDHDQNS